MMKVVYNILWTCNSGGMERVLANKANYLIQCGFQVTIITTDQQGMKSFFKLDERIKQIDLGINYTADKEFGPITRMWNYFLKQRRHKRLLKDVLEEQRSDITISMFDHDTPFLYKIRAGGLKFLEIHFSRYKRLQYGRKGILKWIDQIRSRQDLFLAKKYDRFIVLTEEDRQYWGKLSNIAVIPNSNTFMPIAMAGLTNKRALAVGRLDYQKGFHDLISAWKLIVDKHPSWVLDIYGDGPLKDKLMEHISILGLSGSVYINPPTENIMQVYLESSVYLMTSRYEGLPMALLEAQACGLPIVSYSCKCGPMDIVVDGKTGYLVTEGNIRLFAEKVVTIMGSEALRKQMGHAAKMRSVLFSEERVMRQWLNLMDNSK